MNLPTQPYKGARDFYPEDKRLQKHIFKTLRCTVESFGYEEYDAPILELFDLFAAKTGEEIVNQQSYTFTDRGGRKVAIRPEMTPSVSRMVAKKRKQLTYPLRWYSIPNLWRYERPQKGRFREHWQLNVDLFGEASIDAEIEMIQVADQIFQNFKAKRSMYEIRLNSRQFINHLTGSVLKLDETKSHKLIKLLDRKDKMSASDFKSDVLKLISADNLALLTKILDARNIKDLDKALQSNSALVELGKLIDNLSALGISNVVFSPTLMRGLDYYTDIVFEIYDTHPENNRSMMGGGRYDGLVGLFGVEEIPTVGFGLGDATLSNFLSLHNLLPEISSETKLAVLTIGDVYVEASKIIEKLRAGGVNAAVDFSERKIAAKIKWALSKEIPFVIVIGTQEINTGKFKLKELSSSKETTLSIEQIMKSLG